METIEINILNHLMQNPYDFSLLPDEFPAEVFSDEVNREIFLAITDLRTKRMSLDKIVVCEWTSSYSKLNKNSDFFLNHLNAISYNAFTSSVFSSYVKILVSKYVKSKLSEQAMEIISGKKLEDSDIESVIESNIRSNQKLKNLFYRKNDLNEGDSKLYFNTMQKIASGKNGDSISKSISSGFKIFDENMGGWRSGQLIVIGARPGMGKTSFLISSISNIIKNYQFPLAYFSVEHTPEQTMTRLISKASGISINKLESGKVTEEEMLQIHEATEYISDSRLHMLQLSDCTLEEVLDNACRLIAEKGIKMLLIDYLQLLNVRSKSFKTRDSEISHITRTLKIFSRENHIPIIITSQLSRDVERRSAFHKRPFLSDLRDSGAIEQDASQIIFIYRPEYYGYVEDENGNSIKGIANIILAKNDNGLCKEFKFRFTGYCSRFEEVEDDNDSFLNTRNDDFDDESPF